MSPPAEVAEWYHLEGVELPNAPKDDPLDDRGDNVAIVTRWAPPDPFDGITLEHASQLRRVCVKAAESGVPLRVEPRADNWIGYEIGDVCGFDMRNSEAGEARAKYVAKTWAKNGVLEQFEGRDATRKVRQCYRPGPGRGNERLDRVCASATAPSGTPVATVARVANGAAPMGAIARVCASATALFLLPSQPSQLVVNVHNCSLIAPAAKSLITNGATDATDPP
ncbi:hypothetical protein [Tateyamaria sp. Alg231-49]|uniref:hypothetical protein n=1 Tax=Tateyamaria sp. Alg231-49 TaxID=1922219 RepID=UPI00131EEBCF|nr:hypothetical protein [Tateyamaria sp. Alg231-49]